MRRIFKVIGMMPVLLLSMACGSSNQDIYAEAPIEEVTPYDFTTNTMSQINDLIAGGQDLELAVTDGVTLLVGINGDVKPGLYQVFASESKGGFRLNRDQFKGLKHGAYISLGIEGDSNLWMVPTSVQLLLFEGDSLVIDRDSTLHFKAITQPQLSNEIGLGNFIVGIDIAPGKYTLSTNREFSSEENKQNTGWEFEHCALASNESVPTAGYQKSCLKIAAINYFNYKDSDVIVDLKEGDVITTDFKNPIFDKSQRQDDARLIFIPVN